MGLQAQNSIKPENQAAIELIDSWFSEPDNMGEEFWAEYEKEIEICQA